MILFVNLGADEKRPKHTDRCIKRMLIQRTIIGAITFNVGWGISGQCLDSAISSIGSRDLPILIKIAFRILGTYGRGIFFGQ